MNFPSISTTTRFAPETERYYLVTHRFRPSEPTSADDGEWLADVDTELKPPHSSALADGHRPG